MSTPRLFAIFVLACLSVASVSAQPVEVPSFNSVALRSGGEVVIRHGAVQRVTILEGGPAARISVVEGEKLLIDNRGHPHGTRIRIEIVTPVLTGVSVEDGGSLAVMDGFPRQQAVAAAIVNGGMLDLRRLPVGQVLAAVRSGGRIAVRPSGSLVAAVREGGNITYWGNPSVTKAIRDGGAIEQGHPGDADRPIRDFAPPPVPAIPPLPNLIG